MTFLVFLLSCVTVSPELISALFNRLPSTLSHDGMTRQCVSVNVVFVCRAVTGLDFGIHSWRSTAGCYHLPIPWGVTANSPCAARRFRCSCMCFAFAWHVSIACNFDYMLRSCFCLSIWEQRRSMRQMLDLWLFRFRSAVCPGL